VERQPAARYVGVDPDPRILAISRRRLEKAGEEVELRNAYAQEPSLPAGRSTS